MGRARQASLHEQQDRGIAACLATAQRNSSSTHTAALGWPAIDHPSSSSSSEGSQSHRTTQPREAQQPPCTIPGSTPRPPSLCGDSGCGRRAPFAAFPPPQALHACWQGLLAGLREGGREGAHRVVAGEGEELGAVEGHALGVGAAAQHGPQQAPGEGVHRDGGLRRARRAQRAWWVLAAGCCLHTVERLRRGGGVLGCCCHLDSCELWETGLAGWRVWRDLRAS